MNNDLINLALQLKERRKELKLTIKELYNLSGVSTTVISDFENCEYCPRIDILYRLTQALKLPLTITTNIVTNNTPIFNVEGLTKREIEEVKKYIEFIKYKK